MSERSAFLARENGGVQPIRSIEYFPKVVERDGCSVKESANGQGFRFVFSRLSLDLSKESIISAHASGFFTLAVRFTRSREKDLHPTY